MQGDAAVARKRRPRTKGRTGDRPYTVDGVTAANPEEDSVAQQDQRTSRQRALQARAACITREPNKSACDFSWAHLKMKTKSPLFFAFYSKFPCRNCENYYTSIEWEFALPDDMLRIFPFRFLSTLRSLNWKVKKEKSPLPTAPFSAYAWVFYARLHIQDMIICSAKHVLVVFVHFHLY